MVSRITSILPFVIITLLCFFGVVAFYLALNRFLTVSEHVQQNVDRRAEIHPQNADSIDGAGSDYSVIVERNLFGDPPLGGKAGEVEATDPLAGLEATSLDLVLMGVVAGRNQESRAVILTKKDKKQQIYQIGDMVAGAQIQDILWGRVVLRTNGRDEILDMNEAAKYRSRRVAVAVPVAARVPQQDGSAPPENVAASEDGEKVDPLIPERVRIDLPTEESATPQNEE